MLVLQKGWYMFREDFTWNNRENKSTTWNFLKGSLIKIDHIDYVEERVNLGNMIGWVPWNLPVVRMVPEDETPQYLVYEMQRKSCAEQGNSAYEITKDMANAISSYLVRDVCLLQKTLHQYNNGSDKLNTKTDHLKKVRKLLAGMVMNIYGFGYQGRINIDADIRTLLHNIELALFDDIDDAGEHAESLYEQDQQNSKPLRHYVIKQSVDDFYSVQSQNPDYPFDWELHTHPDFHEKKLNSAGIWQTFFHEYQLFTHDILVYGLVENK